MSQREPYRVTYTRRAERELKRLPPDDAARTRGPVLALALEPRPYGAGPVHGTGYWRLRVAQVRVVYLLDDDEREVVVVRVARRSESAYRRLREEREA